MAEPIVIEEVRHTLRQFRATTEAHAQAVEEAKRRLETERAAALTTRGRTEKQAQEQLGRIQRCISEAQGRLETRATSPSGLLNSNPNPAVDQTSGADAQQELAGSIAHAERAHHELLRAINWREGFLSWVMRIFLIAAIVGAGALALSAFGTQRPVLGVLWSLTTIICVIFLLMKFVYSYRIINAHLKEIAQDRSNGRFWANIISQQAAQTQADEVAQSEAAHRRTIAQLGANLAAQLARQRAAILDVRQRLGYQAADWEDPAWERDQWPKPERAGFGGLVFATIAADPVRAWPSSSSQQGISVPIGHAGSLPLELELGEHAPRHALILGRRGSGKSTLLHVLITNLALTYDPREIELHLLDLSRAEEFEAYAAHELPQAPVIGVAGKREFGLAMLQRLDAKLTQRAGMLSDSGSATLADYRTAHPDAAYPRILLIVDEVGEFFVEDDDIARQASELLQRLARLGGAAGMHLVLSSRTLAGSQALPKAVIDQIDLRLALACTEADSQVLLREDNPVRRQLCWPGEAVYNAEKGAVTGNVLFQVAWLDDRALDGYLDGIRNLARSRQSSLQLPVISDANPPFSSHADANGNGTRREGAFTMRGPVSAHVGELRAISCGEQLAFPGLFAFPGERNLLIKAPSSQRPVAFEALRSIVLRLLATIPPGKLRLTLVDRVGQSRNLASFMELSEYDDELVTKAVWTDERDIERELSDLERRIATIHQKYLRQEYRTIDDYNAHAGEVAEPYRLLVVTGFPSGFTDQAAKTLETIASSGPTCGVYTFIVMDTEQKMPRDFQLGNLERESAVIAWNGSQFAWAAPDIADCHLTLDNPPGIDPFKHILQAIGKQAQESSRVEVPFDRVAAQPRRSWPAASTRDGIVVPVGRVGARKNQLFDLGKGTAQHVLLVGKTGSGKSTLMHVLVTNLALTYNPNELQLYLIDFKEGVEFKTYAEHHLPHARVIAIESEREFGLSVLEGLVDELRRRGEIFRARGKQNIREYRGAEPDAVCPRILLVVDEFQVFFAEDDDIARRAGELLDELARQGRAFGIHVVLGSQTLRGSQSVHNSTAGQMGVRIAMQCSEDDARLILADDNPAARLLSRPGEAIYNADNGHPAGNSPFQTVWLDEETRERYLDQINELAAEQDYITRPPIVFEGNAPGVVSANEPLKALLALPEAPETIPAASAWLGEPIAIKEPTAARFRNQSSSNLLIVGQRDEAALGMMATSLVSLASQYMPTKEGETAPGVCFYVLDFTPADARYAGVWQQVRNAVPYPIWVAGKRELPQIIGELSAEVERRMHEDESNAPPVYLFIYGLQRARDLRPDEDTMFPSFGSMDAPPAPSPAKQFPVILREGPDYGVHTVIWCDTVLNLNRTLDRRSLREFDMRVAFQMGADDSSSLIDTPAANKIGPYRALYYSEEEGRQEKFRPYGIPPTSWLDQVHEQLYRRARRVPV